MNKTASRIPKPKEALQSDDHHWHNGGDIEIGFCTEPVVYFLTNTCFAGSNEIRSWIVPTAPCPGSQVKSHWPGRIGFAPKTCSTQGTTSGFLLSVSLSTPYCTA